MRRSTDVLLVVLLDAIALVGIVAAWYGVSGARLLGDQMGPLTLGVAALALAGVANALFLINQRRTLSERLALVLPRGAGDRR